MPTQKMGRERREVRWVTKVLSVLCDGGLYVDSLRI